jgi:hypothetical protein
MTRHAILVANSVAYGDAHKRLPRVVARTVTSDFEARLDELGGSSFQVLSVLDRPMQEAAAAIRDTIKTTSSKTDLLLFYYFGHAVRPIDDKEALHLYFRDSDWLEPPSMLDFDDITKWLIAYKPPKVLVILDCCYAGAVATKLRILQKYGGRHFLMASVSHKGKAQVDFGEAQPIGIFSKYLLDAFSASGARAPLGTEVTFQSFFNFANTAVRSASSQEPFATDGDLGDEVFFEQSLQAAVPSSLRHGVPRKSVYFKLYSLLHAITSTRFASDSALYKSIQAHPPREFLTPVKVGRDRIEYRPIGEDAFDTYLYLARLLGLLRPSAPPRATPLGTSMIRKAGAAFNSSLFSALMAMWRSRGIDLPDLHKAIGQRLAGNGIPDVDSIFLDLYVTRSLRMSKELFKILLDLTGYVGALRYSTHHTFFLPAAQEPPDEEE